MPAREKVSILTRPQGRVLPLNLWTRHPEKEGVSILTRPQGRVLHAPAIGQGVGSACFNPHPPTGTGAAVPHRVAHLILIGVSILTRPQGRVLLLPWVLLSVESEPPNFLCGQR